MFFINLTTLQKDEIFLTNMFKSVVMEAAYPLLHVTSLPEPRWANQQAEEVGVSLINCGFLSNHGTLN